MNICRVSRVGTSSLLLSAALSACGAPPVDGPGPSSTSGDGDGDTGTTDIVIGDGDTGDTGDVPEPGGSDNKLGIATNVILKPECAADCSGFSDPSDPTQPLVIVDDGVTDTQRKSLDQAATADALCVSEPAQGSIFPAAWTRPRFNADVTGPAKITLTTSRMRHSFTYYAAQMPALLPLAVWESLSKSVYNEDIQYTVVSDGKAAAGSFQVAPVAAGGSMVFWGSTGTEPGPQTNALYGFGVGEEGVIKALAPGDFAGVALQDNANLRDEYADEKGQSVCVGCHASSPDGRAVATVDHWEWNLRVGSIEPGQAGAAPEFLSAAGAAMLSMTWLGAPTFSLGDWDTGAHRMITSWSERDITTDPGSAWKTHDGSVPHDSTPIWPSELIWMDLSSSAAVSVDLRSATATSYVNNNQDLQKAVAAMRGGSWEKLERTGDDHHAVMPDWSHSGASVVYTSTDAPQDGRVGTAKEVDIYEVPFAGGAGGDATPVDGAAEADFFEYYPDYSPDDELIAFNRVPKYDTGTDKKDAFNHVYYRPESDIYVVSPEGGAATRLSSNDPVCGGESGKLYNSWAKWAPSMASDGEKTYYFLIFSTARNSPMDIPRGQDRKSPASQLYMTTVIKNADGSIESGAAIYLWNQRNLVSGSGDAAEVSELLTNNVTPAWDQFQIPAVPDVIIR